MQALLKVLACRAQVPALQQHGLSLALSWMSAEIAEEVWMLRLNSLP